ncbi:MAG TPA: bifunctional phosphoribosyl-AMP cyclohydrolase/phosphoribosyl-ATP diphosphatase HisIE [Buchnera sp. (in: enterobacteria)]|nr:bifunctional phosphoribosyl-AMP cyclohydrolase/phosphoribosyl-ATP diphosphatase HisIE [Buchnera sp. (in: enterobacteria)]
MLNQKDFYKIHWDKINGMLPVIIQHYISGEILMHGYMNQEALLKTNNEKIVTFYSRTKKRLWTKGETSKNYLKVINISIDCDYDTILVLVDPINNTCHLGKNSCFSLPKMPNYIFLYHLEKLLKERKNINPKLSYTAQLYSSGIKRIAQKVAEEGIETALSAVTNNKKELMNEAADLIFHLLVLLESQNLNFNIIIEHLYQRHI